MKEFDCKPWELRGEFWIQFRPLWDDLRAKHSRREVSLGEMCSIRDQYWKDYKAGLVEAGRLSPAEAKLQVNP